MGKKKVISDVPFVWGYRVKGIRFELRKK